ncbi:hypothetical protein RCL1_006229 [Eukaryota sp. TZLM3-RCL]
MNTAGLDPFSMKSGGLGLRIHIRVVQRKNKSVTVIEGLPDIFDYKKVLKILRQDLFCNGTIQDDPQFGSVITLNGDHRYAVQRFLIYEDLCEESDIQVHGAS